MDKNNQSQIVEDIRNQFIEKISDNMNAFGTSTSVGRVLGIIYMNKEPMTLDEIAQENGSIKSRKSQILRDIIDMNFTERGFNKWFRKELYTGEEDYYDTFIYLFTSTWQQSITRNRHFEKKQTGRLDELKK